MENKYAKKVSDYIKLRTKTFADMFGAKAYKSLTPAQKKKFEGTMKELYTPKEANKEDK